MRLSNLAFAEESRKPFGNLNLSWMGPRLMNSPIECLRRSLQSFKRHGARQIRQVQ